MLPVKINYGDIIGSNKVLLKNIQTSQNQFYISKINFVLIIHFVRTNLYAIN